MEGAIWYTYSKDGRLLQYKCKPEYVQDMHFAASGKIPIHSIKATITNSFEDREDPDFDYIVDLLREEYSDEKIYKKEVVIRRELDRIKHRRKVQARVWEVYQDSGLDFNEDKPQVMRMIAMEMLADYPRGHPQRKKVSQIAFNYLQSMFEC
jgi:hypothetical protein